MSLLQFSDILKLADINPEKVKMIRHSLNDKGFKDCFDRNMVLEYTKKQKKNFAKDFEYWAVFVGDSKTLAKFYGFYIKGDSVSDKSDVCPPDFPHPEWFTGEDAYFELTPSDTLKEYEGKIIIEWGKSTVSWHQKGTIEKSVIAIYADEKKMFSGFENLIISYTELKDILENPVMYDQWHTALSSVYAIYLIVDKVTGQQYVGSAYGESGLLGRWGNYVQSHHGNNKRMIELLDKYPDRHYSFQFTILQILPKTITSEGVIKIEQEFKRKLLTVEFGLNDN